MIKNKNSLICKHTLNTFKTWGTWVSRGWWYNTDSLTWSKRDKEIGLFDFRINSLNIYYNISVEITSQIRKEKGLFTSIVISTLFKVWWESYNVFLLPLILYRILVITQVDVIQLHSIKTKIFCVCVGRNLSLQ